MLPSPDPARPPSASATAVNPLLPGAGSKLMAALGVAGVVICPLVLDDPFWIKGLGLALIHISEPTRPY